MKRKNIQIADSTQLVSLPRKWALKNSIKKGDEVDVTIENNKVVVSTEKDNKFSTISFDVSDYNLRMIRWTLSLLYKTYDEAELFFKSKKQLKHIQEVIKSGDMLAFEIMEQGEKRCVVRVISRGLEQEFDSILRRVFLVTLSLAERSRELIEQKQYSELEEINVLEGTNNKFKFKDS